MCQVHYRQVRKEKTMGRAPDALVSGIKEAPPTKGLGFPIPSTADTRRSRPAVPATKDRQPLRSHPKDTARALAADLKTWTAPHLEDFSSCTLISRRRPTAMRDHRT